MSILRLSPACKSYLWGGNKLKKEFHKSFSGPILAETWELSCHPDGPSTIVSGVHKGQTLREYLTEAGSQALGTNCARFEDFPILIKLIDASKELSVQVHPNNAYAKKNEHQYGKTEMWYVIDCEPGAFLYYGLKKHVSKEEFRQHIADNTLDQILNAVSVHKGDTFFIAAGTIHAIGKGIVIAEIQQNSNVTYRVYDYGRIGADGKPRDLHVDKALDVAHLEPPHMDYSFGGHLAQVWAAALFLADVFLKAAARAVRNLAIQCCGKMANCVHAGGMAVWKRILLQPRSFVRRSVRRKKIRSPNYCCSVEVNRKRSMA